MSPLSRPQIEFVVCRVSYLNECIFLVVAHGGLLRASALATDTPLELRGVTHAEVDPLLPGGHELRAFATGCPIPAGAWRMAGPLGVDLSR